MPNFFVPNSNLPPVVKTTESSDRPLHIYFRKDAHSYVTPEMDRELSKKINLERIFCDNWTDVSAAIEQGARQMVIHISMLTHPILTVTELLIMISTLTVLAGSEMAIFVSIEPTTSLQIIKQLKKSKVLGISPSGKYWGMQEVATALTALTKRQVHWPKHILDQLPGDKKPKHNTKGISTTPRQQEVLALIKDRGLSNKQIAKSLSISESTVKMHISDMMKKYGVKTRTQLAVMSLDSV